MMDSSINLKNIKDNAISLQIRILEDFQPHQLKIILKPLTVKRKLINTLYMDLPPKNMRLPLKEVIINI